MQGRQQRSDGVLLLLLLLLLLMPKLTQLVLTLKLSHFLHEYPQRLAHFDRTTSPPPQPSPPTF